MTEKEKKMNNPDNCELDPIGNRMKGYIRDMICVIGEDPDREGLLGTPDRIIRSWKELYSGYGEKPEKILGVTFESESDEMIILKQIEFASSCEHHMMPFTGVCHIGYIPDGRIVGISKLARLVDIYSRRLQIQERVTTQIADAIMAHLKPKGCMVVMNAVHLCMRIRGVSKQNSTMITQAVRGIFADSPGVRNEFSQSIR